MNKKGLSTLEFCILFAIVAAGLIAMMPYLRRAIEGHWKTNADNFSEGQFDTQDSAKNSENSSQITLVNPKFVVNVDKTGSAVTLDLGDSAGSVSGNAGTSVIKSSSVSIKPAKLLQPKEMGTYSK